MMLGQWRFPDPSERGGSRRTGGASQISCFVSNQAWKDPSRLSSGNACLAHRSSVWQKQGVNPKKFFAELRRRNVYKVTEQLLNMTESESV